MQVSTRRVVRDKKEDTDALDILLAAACVGNDVLVKKALAAGAYILMLSLHCQRSRSMIYR